MRRQRTRRGACRSGTWSGCVYACTWPLAMQNHCAHALLLFELQHFTDCTSAWLCVMQVVCVDDEPINQSVLRVLLHGSQYDLVSLVSAPDVMSLGSS